MIKLKTLMAYAKATNGHITIVGDNVDVFYVNGKAVITRSHINDGYVSVKDASSRKGAHNILYTLMGEDLFFDARRNWVTGAEQRSFNRGFNFELHVADVLKQQS